MTLLVPVSSSQDLSPVSAPSLAGDTTYVPQMTFDVASVRESNPDPIKGFMVGGGFIGRTSSLNASNLTISSMLATAFALSVHQIEGLPDWTSRPMYNVKAKADDAADQKLATLSEERVRLEQQHMFQALLADRFNLKVHRATRERPIYNLVVTKAGPKGHPGGSSPPSAEELKNFSDRKIPEIYQRGDGRRGYELIGHNCHIASLTGKLKGFMGTDVIDRTGLTGTYDFDLQYSYASDAEREEDPTIWPRLTDSLADQLGFRLEHAKGLVETLVVDSIEKPTEN